MFRLIRDPGLEYECFLVGLIYSGLDLSEIAAARFNDFEVIELQGGEVCHTLTVTKRVRKLNERYAHQKAQVVEIINENRTSGKTEVPFCCVKK